MTSFQNIVVLSDLLRKNVNIPVQCVNLYLPFSFYSTSLFFQSPSVTITIGDVLFYARTLYKTTNIITAAQS